MLKILRWAKRVFLVLIGVFLLYQGWLFGWVVYWKNHNPEMTRFMQIRLNDMRAQNPQSQLKKQWVDYAKVSVYLKRALISSEDDLFMQHDGFDWDGIQKAIERNQQKGRIVAGGSTISQQLAKNLFLSPAKTPWRKAEETLITLMIEHTWSKQRIFEVYLNVIEWGNGVFGAEAAARHYFGVSAAKLSPAQAAKLAAMTPNPRFYDKNRNTPALARKTEIILNRMQASQVP